MARAPAPVRLERDDAVAVLTLDSPPLNLFDEPLLEALRAGLGELAASPPRALLVRAEGTVVSAGLDVSLFASLDRTGAAELFGGDLVALTGALEALPCPTVFAAHALCLTAAFELSLACDVLLAAESARFGLVEARMGVTPALGGTQRLAERAGPGRARELVMTGDLYEAVTLERWNVVNRVLPDAGFDEAARAFAAQLAAGPPLAHAATKELLRAYRAGGVAAADAAVPEVVAPLFESEDCVRAARSFLEHGPRQRVDFHGR